MIYVTGDCHCDFRRFTRHKRELLPFKLKSNDYVIVCGDLGLLWADDKEYEYNKEWLGSLPFKILWVQGNHENYSMINEFPVEEWNGGKVRHIVRDKIILLERGQVFEIEGKTFFTFGGASSHDISDGILDRNDPDFRSKLLDLKRKNKYMYRILNESWWKEELPTDEEMSEGYANLEKVGNKVDYVITHCCSSELEEMLNYKDHDKLTDFFNYVEKFVDFQHWYFGHYHQDFTIDDKHTMLYYRIVPIDQYKEYYV